MQRLRFVLSACILCALVAPVQAKKKGDSAIISGKEVRKLKRQSEKGLEDAILRTAEIARALGYTEGQIERAVTPSVDLRSRFYVTLENGTRVSLSWARIGFAENRLANTDKSVDRSLLETIKGGYRFIAGVSAHKAHELALDMDQKLALGGDAINGHMIRGGKLNLMAPKIVGKDAYIDPTTLSQKDLDTIAYALGKSYLRAGGIPGPGADIGAGDMNFKQEQQKAVARAFREGLGDWAEMGISGRDFVEGDPSGGISFRRVSTGAGVLHSLELALDYAGARVRGAVVGTEGLGEVGWGMAEGTFQDGMKMTAISERVSMGEHKVTKKGRQYVVGKVSGTFLHPAMLRRSGESDADIRARLEALTVADVRRWVTDIRDFIGSKTDINKAKASVRTSFVKGMALSDVDFLDGVGINGPGGTLNDVTVPKYAQRKTFQGNALQAAEGANSATTPGGSREIERLKDRFDSRDGRLANIGGVNVSDMIAVQNLYGEMVNDPAAERALGALIEQTQLEARAQAQKDATSVRKAIEMVAVDRFMKRSLKLPGAPINNLEELVISEARRAAMPNALAEHARRHYDPITTQPHLRTNQTRFVKRTLRTASRAASRL